MLKGKSKNIKLTALLLLSRGERDWCSSFTATIKSRWTCGRRNKLERNEKIQNIDTSIYISMETSVLTPEVEYLFVCLISTDANTTRIEGKEESTYLQCTGCKMVTEALNVVKRQRFDFL